MNAYVPWTQPVSVYEWLGWTAMVWVHWALSELLAAAASAWEPEWTGLETTLSSGEQVHGDSAPDSKPGLASRLPGTGVRVGVAVGVGVPPPPPPSVARCGPTVPENAFPLDASQLMDHVIAPRMLGNVPVGLKLPQLVPFARQSSAAFMLAGGWTPLPAADEDAGRPRPTWSARTCWSRMHARAVMKSTLPSK